MRCDVILASTRKKFPKITCVVDCCVFPSLLMRCRRHRRYPFIIIALSSLVSSSGSASLLALYI